MLVYGIPAARYGFIHVFQSSEELRDAVDHDPRMRILLDGDKDFPGVFIAGSVWQDNRPESRLHESFMEFLANQLDEAARKIR